MHTSGIVTGFRVARDHAAVGEIESARFDEGAVRRLHARPGVAEAFALQTCHRVEAYAVATDAETGFDALAEAFDVGRAAVRMGHDESLRHLLRVAAGLESLVVGEDQILGQVRDAHAVAQEAGVLGPVLDDAVTKAIRVGERVRTETAINEGVVSLGSAAVEVTGRERDLAGARALVVGAGEMGTLAAKAFAAAGVREVTVANRTAASAEAVADAVDCDARAVPLASLPTAVEAADVVVTATSSDRPVLDADAFEGAGGVVVVDLAQPRDVAADAASLPAVTTYDLDDLERVTEATERRRRAAAAAAERIVDQEYERLLEGYKRKRADEVIATMYESAERVKAREVDTALSRLDARGEVTDEQREVVESLADSLVSQLLAPPTKSLRTAAANDDWATISTALQLFDPDIDDASPLAAVAAALSEADGDAAASDDAPVGVPDAATPFGEDD